MHRGRGFHFTKIPNATHIFGKGIVLYLFHFYFSDIYVACLSNQNQVAAKDYYLGFVSTTVETDNPALELNAGLSLLEPILHKFVSVKTVYHPVDDGKASQVGVNLLALSSTPSHRYKLHVPMVLPPFRPH